MYENIDWPALNQIFMLKPVKPLPSLNMPQTIVMQSAQSVMTHLREQCLKQQPAQFQGAIDSSLCGEHAENREREVIRPIEFYITN